MWSELIKEVQDIQNLRQEGDLLFAVVADTGLRDETETLREQLKILDETLHLDFLVHLGDILRGGSPEKISRRILREELAAWRDCIANGSLYVTQGEKDGWRDESFRGQLVTGIMTERVWQQDTGHAPYYYADAPESCTRLIFLHSCRCEYDGENKMFRRYPEFAMEQLAWLKNQALEAPDGWNVLVFSHAIPGCKFETGIDPASYKGNAIDLPFALLQEGIRQRGMHFISWLCGHYGREETARVASMEYRSIEGMGLFLLKTKEHMLYYKKLGEV